MTQATSHGTAITTNAGMRNERNDFESLFTSITSTMMIYQEYLYEFRNAPTILFGSIIFTIFIHQ